MSNIITKSWFSNSTNEHYQIIIVTAKRLVCCLLIFAWSVWIFSVIFCFVISIEIKLIWGLNLHLCTYHTWCRTGQYMRCFTKLKSCICCRCWLMEQLYKTPNDRMKYGFHTVPYVSYIVEDVDHYDNQIIVFCSDMFCES